MANLVFKDHPADWRTGHDFPHVPLTRVSWDTFPERTVAYVFFGHVNIDFDGSSTAYGPTGISPIPDDDLGNAWNEAKGWFGVLALSETDPLVKNKIANIDKKPELLHHGKYPVIQQAKNGDPNPGFYVSTTPRASGPSYLQSSYMMRLRFRGELCQDGSGLSDLVSVIMGLRFDTTRAFRAGSILRMSGGIPTPWENVPTRSGKNLGGSGRASHFNNNFPVSFIVFPESGIRIQRQLHHSQTSNQGVLNFTGEGSGPGEQCRRTAPADGFQ